MHRVRRIFLGNILSKHNLICKENNIFVLPLKVSLRQNNSLKRKKYLHLPEQSEEDFKPQFIINHMRAVYFQSVMLLPNTSQQ